MIIYQDDAWIFILNVYLNIQNYLKCLPSCVKCTMNLSGTNIQKKSSFNNLKYALAKISVIKFFNPQNHVTLTILAQVEHPVMYLSSWPCVF